MVAYKSSFNAGCRCSLCVNYIKALLIDGPESTAQHYQIIDYKKAKGLLSSGWGGSKLEDLRPIKAFTLGAGASAFKAVTHDTGEVSVNRRETMWKSVKTSSGKAVTQKVRGLRAVGTVSSMLGSDYEHISDWRYLSAKEVVADPSLANDDLCFYPLFLRPCPVVPRHGFVDSRLVYSPEEMREVARETVEQDPEAELLRTPFISARESAVLTPTTFSLGAGHDGATSGKSSTVYGPGAGTFLKEIRSDATIEAPDVPYIELVGDKMAVVQVRGGPPLESVLDYVPDDVTVTEVLVATEDTDLLEWEKAIASAKTGTVVYADGLSLASHFCVHAVVHKVPVMTTKRPRVADMLKKTNVPKWTRKDWRRLARYFTEADRVSVATGIGNSWPRLAVAALHCAGTPAPASDAHLRFLAYGAVGALKCVGSACLGEARHIDSSSHDHYNNTRRRKARPSSEAMTRSEPMRQTGRNSYYKRGAEASLESWKHILMALSPVYNHRRWKSNYGGQAWGRINASARLLANHISKFRKAPSARSWARLVTTWNVMIHREHNGKAPALSKFGVHKYSMDQIAQFPLIVLGRLVTPEFRSTIFNGPAATDVRAGVTKMVIPPKKPKSGYRTLKVPVKVFVGTSTIGLYSTQGEKCIANLRDQELRTKLLSGEIKHSCNQFEYIGGHLEIRERVNPKEIGQPVLTLAKVLNVTSCLADHSDLQIESFILNRKRYELDDNQTDFYGVS